MPTAPQNILIVRPSALGDVARTVPALVSLRRAHPQAKIDWLVNDSFADVVRDHPDLNEVVPFPRKRFTRFGRSVAVTREVWSYFQGLRKRRYDFVYDLQGLGRSGWLTWMTRAPRRIGPADAREGGWLAYNKRVRVPDTLVHTVDRMLAVLEGDGVAAMRDMRLYVGAEHGAWAEEYGRVHGVDPQGIAVIAPTAAWVSKRWPAERFDALIERLGGWGIKDCLVVGSSAERADVARLLDKSKPGPRRHDLLGQTSVGQLMAVLERAALVVANDSAALHIAMGLGRRCVGLFGPTDPEKVGPYKYSAGVVATERPAGIHYRAVKDDQSLIAGITIEQALQGVARVFEAPPPATGHGETP